MDKNMKRAILLVILSIIFIWVGYFMRNVMTNAALIGWGLALVCQVISFFYVYRFIFNK